MVADPDTVAMLKAAESQMWAAWLQAVGAIAALAIAVGIPAVQANAEKKRRNTKAKALALLVMADVAEVRDRADMVLNQSSLQDAALLNEGIEKMLAIPPDLLASRSVLHELGAVSTDIIRLIALMQMAGRELANFQIMMRTRPEDRDTTGDPDKVRGGLQDIAELAAEVSNKIGTLYGERPLELSKRASNW